jgi:hypothetical protein
MSGVIVVDTNLLVLLVVGSASIEYINKHKRLTSFSTDDFELLVELIGMFSDIVMLPHILSETSNLIKQIDNPARLKIQHSFGTLINTTTELPLPSVYGVQRSEFAKLGLTDAMILRLCSLTGNGIEPTLLTTDTALANTAHSLGYSVIDYKQEYQTG